ncbi:hypothetical protein ABW19_dt0201116 [Dactylella cylindrospora]|nr:hypothetical protein ABW19_dt0201116 [Dactylella cylindrospora]
MPIRCPRYSILASPTPVFAFSEPSLLTPPRLRSRNATFSTHSLFRSRPTISRINGYKYGFTRGPFPTSSLTSRNVTVTAGGTSIPVPSPEPPSQATPAPHPTFQTGFSLYAKRPPRPFPKPWINPPTSSFSEPLSIHSTSLSRRPLYPHQHVQPDLYAHDPSKAPIGGRFLRGYTNGDDALLVHNRYLAVADGVGSWNLRDRGYPALWSRLMVHYFSIGCERFFNRSRRRILAAGSEPDIQNILKDAFTAVIKATGASPSRSHANGMSKEDAELPYPTSETQRYHGTTTFTGCILNENKLYIINVGDSHCLLLRPSEAHKDSKDGEAQFLLKTVEQWHYFDCPRQLGTDSPDTPLLNSTVDVVEVQEGDVVILSSDGLLDNLWEEEVISIILRQLGFHDEVGGEVVGEMMKEKGKKGVEEGVNVAFREDSHKDGNSGTVEINEGAETLDDEEGGELMTSVAAELVKAAKVIATDPSAESPWMERAITEGLGAEGGKLDDISVVVGRVVGAHSE